MYRVTPWYMTVAARFSGLYATSASSEGAVGDRKGVGGWRCDHARPEHAEATKSDANPAPSRAAWEATFFKAPPTRSTDGWRPPRGSSSARTHYRGTALMEREESASPRALAR